ncbi:MAG: ATP-dependent RecD-like DNA helicase [Clostridia bacterium]|nr:ATP-dependent RecD-like DNA helicase [Clostridia bacterium]
MDTLEATVVETTYRNEDNGYTVLQARTLKERVTVVGILPEVASGEQIILKGQWVEHPQYGRQWKAEGCEILKPTTLLGIERYLGSGLIKGVGPATAKLICLHFGQEALTILEEHPERLSEVPKIGKKRAAMIAESYHEQIQTRQAMVFLQSYGIAPNLAVKISRLYGDQTAILIRENPYRLIDDLDGVGFLTADRIALSLGIAPDSPYRLRSAIKYVLKDAAAGSGHIYLPREEAEYRAARITEAAQALIRREMDGLALRREIIVSPGAQGEDGVYLPQYHRAEKEVARRLVELDAAIPKGQRRQAARQIAEFEKMQGIALSELQRAAAQAALEHGVLVITGGPGTGKTTLINCIIRLLSQEGQVVLCAPTGRAAKRMTEATGVEAKTIHRLLEYGGDEDAFARDENNPIEADCLIVDEMSMVDLLLMRGLLRAVELGTRLILVGDADQLPSVGAGNTLGDILQSGCIPSVRLTEIFRQEDGSRIVINAHRINQGELPLLNGKGTDFFFEKQASFNQAAQTIVDLVAQRLPKYLKYDDAEKVRSIQVLAPAKKGDCGVWALNKLLQERLNPPAASKPSLTYGETVFRLGDKVIQVKNDYQIEWKRRIFNGWDDGQGVFNGDVGFITEVDPEEHTLTVIFDDDKYVTYQTAQLEELELAYCLSVHKSQGSEFPAVVMPVVGGPPMLLTRNLFYTALTRARQLVVLVGREEVIAAMVRNDHEMKRYTTLPQRLKEMKALIQ